MSHHDHRTDDVEVVPMELPLDRETVSWLTRACRGDDREAARMIASILKMIAEEDELAHATRH